jgi:hypothetical protein
MARERIGGLIHQVLSDLIESSNRSIPSRTHRFIPTPAATIAVIPKS